VPIHNEETIAIFMRRPAATIVHKLYYPVPTLFTQSALFKRSALLSVNGWDEDLVIDDWPLNLKLFSRFGSGFRYIDVFVCANRRHSTNASKRRFRQYIGQKRVLEKYAQGNDLNQGLFALIATQALASLKRKQWWRAQIFFRAAFGRKPGLKFIIIWVNNEFQRRFGSNKIR